MNDLIKNARAQLIAQVKAANIERITSELLGSLLKGFTFWNEGGNRKLTDSEYQVLYKELEEYFIADLNYENDLVVLERGLVISDPKLHKDWQPDPKNRFYWRKHREFLMNILKLRNGSNEASLILNSIDSETEAILNNMENPLRPEFDSRGLVVGYVQSGKTANFTALISKAADAGYRFVVVLAGIHDELRQQTQIRIDKELTGNNNLSLEGSFVEWNDYEEPRRWYNLTSAGWLDGKETGEFSGKGINKFKDVFLSRERPVIAIIKKNVKIMERLIKWAGDSEPRERINVPVLIIDDEADQASVDGNSNKNDTDPTRTNQKIRELLNLFARKAYVGYTATPFANVFIDHGADHEVLRDDLYPRNFIHSLPEPQGYFGTNRIFNDDLDDYFVTLVEDSAYEKRTLGDSGEITLAVINAIYTFILGIAIRNLRGQLNSPKSMMINVDHRVAKMNRIGEVVEEYVRKTLPNHYDVNQIKIAFDEFESASKTLNERLDAGNEIFGFEIVKNEVIRVIKSKEIQIRTLNSNKADKLDYAKEPSMNVIAIGGNKLSRGLTLEGLMVTFYLRESKQFDTLLQMGRWFGYRNGYEDLIRIYTNDILWKQFKELAIVELEFRDSIKDMVESDPPKTPKEYAVGVRQVLGLLPTAKNKLGAAVLQNYYGGSQVSVTRLMLEKPDTIDHNTRATERLILAIANSMSPFYPTSNKQYPSLLAKNVQHHAVVEYLESFEIATDIDGSPLEFDKNNLLNYIRKKQAKESLLSWNVAVISLGAGYAKVSLPQGKQITPVNRARTKLDPVNGAYNIKAVSSKADRQIDLLSTVANEYVGRENPLLLIYYVDRNSSPKGKNEKGYRVNLYNGIPSEMHRDPVSYSIIFPSDNVGAGLYKQPI